MIFSILVMRLRTISNSSIFTWFVCRIKPLRISPQKIQFDVSVNYALLQSFLTVYHYHCFTFYSFKKICNHTPLFLCQVRIYVNYGKSTSMLKWFSIKCHKPKTKLITPANHKRHKQYSKPIRTRINFM